MKHSFKGTPRLQPEQKIRKNMWMGVRINKSLHFRLHGGVSPLLVIHTALVILTGLYAHTLATPSGSPTIFNLSIALCHYNLYRGC